MRRVIEKDQFGMQKERWEYDVIYIEGKEPMEYMKAWTVATLNSEGKYDGYAVIFETPQGDFKLSNGRLVEDPKIFSSMPQKDRERAMAWFKSLHKKSKDGIPIEGEPIEEKNNGAKEVSTL